ncbi:hypothetical protein ACLBKU_10770 [Erythrobacter sp. NE805]|uniref:hypothetical protein n=1 Tax=Erythrobacter sp. NE805 TaxID=3389875 RepID=UPI00396B0C9E
MHSLLALAAPLALMLPLVAETARLPAEGDEGEGGAPQCDAAGAPGVAPVAEVLNPLGAMRQSSAAQQIRIEQRVVVRITPAPLAARQNLLAELPQRPSAPRFEERRKEKCVGLGEIAGVQTGSGNRLVLFLRDRRMLSVNLEKACRARDFYSGFYVEKSKDGRLCVSRDKLQSRTGARCEVEVMRQLVAVPG